MYIYTYSRMREIIRTLIFCQIYLLLQFTHYAKEIFKILERYLADNVQYPGEICLRGLPQF